MKVPIKRAEEISKQYDKTHVIIVTFNNKTGEYTITTYGSTKQLCREAAIGGDKVAEAFKLTKMEK